MRICEFCDQFGRDGSCRLGLKIPNGLSCREFEPTLEKFCAETKDFVNQRQIVEMATFFGIKGSELKKVKLMASQAETNRDQTPGSLNEDLPPDNRYSPYASFSLRK
jgi:hypothetical protein